MEPLAAKFGRALYQLRTSSGLSRKQAAIEAELSLNGLSSIENGTALVKLDTLMRMLQVYGFTIDQFMQSMAGEGIAQSGQTAETLKFSPNARYFILDTKGEVTANNYEDRDFVAYSWRPRQFGKVRKGDWFIYRRPQSASETKSWYMFGAGQIGEITPLSDGRVSAKIERPFPFPEYLLANQDLKNFNWQFKRRTRPDWLYFFNQYGMTEIYREDFVNLLAQARVPHDASLLNEEGAFYRRIIDGQYLVTEKEAQIKARIGQTVLAERVKANYAYRCAVTGIHTRSLLVASHIVPWRVDAGRRLDPGNVICLSPLWDRAFDQGLVTFTPTEKKVVLSPVIQRDPALERLLAPYADRRLRLPGHAEPEPAALEYHNREIFQH